MLVRALVAAAAVWTAALLIAPVAIVSSRPAVSLAAAGVYAAGSRICHQRPDRCFWIRGRPMPVCARCSGLYAGAAVAGPLALLVGAGLSSRRARALTAIAALPTLVTWGIEVAGVAHPSNVVRAVAALPLGLTAAWLVVTTVADARPDRRQGRMQ